MLSGETSVGAYPVEAVQAMDEIVRVAQNHIPKHDPKEYQSSQRSIAETVCTAVYTFAQQVAADKENGADADADADAGAGAGSGAAGKIIVITKTGFAARVISKYRPALPILAFSESLRTVRELALCWGVRAQYLPKLAGNDVETEALCAIEHAMATGYLTCKDKNVCVLIPSSDPSAGFFSGIYDVSRLASKGFKVH
jgi:pyruvate kinase